MEEINKLTEREKLKTYFETGKYPTQIQFAELIDSLRHKDDALSYKDIVNIANRLETLDNRTIEYYSYGIEDLKFPIVISQNDADDLVIEVGNNEGAFKTQKIFGNAPFIITAKEFPVEILGSNEYYTLNYYSYDNITGSSSELQRIFGNNLPTIPDGFEIGTIEGEQSGLNVYKQDMGQQVYILNTDIQFINKTEVEIQYKAHSGYWSSSYTNKDMMTDHYNLADYVNFIFRADLRNIERSIECKVFNTYNEELLMTVHLKPMENNTQAWGDKLVEKIRNIRIECDYQ
mgnify:CR=1 FL=1